MFPAAVAVRPQALSTCAIKAVVVDFPLVPVMPTKTFSGAAPLVEIDIAGDRRTSSLRCCNRRVRGWMCQRNAGRGNQQVGWRPVQRKQIAGGAFRQFCTPFRVVIPGDNFRTACPSRTHGGHAALAETQNRDPPVCKRRQWDHHAHLSFSVARPTSARMREMIQNRITMVGSFQPFCSKW